jgi:CheY-like chemotaxis protein
MADVAANVLHNVGNVLNSVNISAGLVTSTMRQSLIGDIGRIAALLHEHAPALGDYLTSDPKGKQIPTYLVALGDHLTQEQASVLKELTPLSSEMDGIQTTAAIRHQELQTSMRLPIIAMTAHATRDDREQCLQAGLDGYISKPVRADELLAVVEDILPATAWRESRESVDMQAAPVFDRSAALSYVDGDGALLQEMAEAFLADYPPRLAELQEAIAIGDSQALMRAAHSLKGGVASFAAKSTYDAALRLEMMGHNGDLSQAQDAYATLEAELSRLISFLARLGRGSGGRMTTA